MATSMLLPISIVVILAASLTKSELIFHLDPSLTYRLHDAFSRNWTSNLVDSSSFFSTTVANSTQQAELSAGKNATFISLSEEFDTLFGHDPQAVLAVNDSQAIFFEAGIWVPGDGDNGDNGAVWFTANTEAEGYNSTSFPKIHTLNLSNNQVTQPALSHNLTYPVGGTLYGSRKDHAILLATFGSDSIGGSIVKIDTKTLKVKTLVNSYWGYRFNSPDDVAFARFEQGDVIYFSDTTFAAEFYHSGAPQQNNAVWRFDIDTGMLINVIPATGIPVANGIRLNKEGTKLYVNDYSGAKTTQKGNVTASSNLYVYDLDKTGTPSNRRVFGTSIHSLFLPDGIKVDDAGRVWTGENGGIVIRSEKGRILGLINPIPLEQQPSEKLKAPNIANFALAGDEVVIAADNYVYRVKLTQQIVSPDRVGGA